MKKYLLAISAMALVVSGCTDQRFLPETEELTLESAQVSDIEILKGQVLTPCNDEALEAVVCQVLQEKMTERDCTKGMVYVVETSTGAIKAKVSLASIGKQFVPFDDTYNDEQKVIMAGPTYLALLSSGKISSNDVIDTEYGIYKDVRDHNWSRGGYGELTLEQALGYCSQVAFTKAKELVFGNQTILFNNKISEYLAGMPDNAMGILTFYNAVANGGRMVKLHTEGDEVIVLNDQIAAPEHISTLQQGLRRAVSQGLFRKAANKYTNVAACGRKFRVDKKTCRMELCGYFPADSPKYTIMVVLEKIEILSGAGGMCGAILASIIDILTDSYDMHSVVARNTEYTEEQDVVVVDTIAAE